VRTGQALLGEIERSIWLTAGIPHPVATALAVIDGAGEPLTPSQVSDRVLVASATMTATLDLLEHRGWIRRVPNPADRRSVLIEITPDGRATADQLLPGIRAVEKSILSALTPAERAQLLDMLAKILAGQPTSPPGNPNPRVDSATGLPASAASPSTPDQHPAPQPNHSQKIGTSGSCQAPGFTGGSHGARQGARHDRHGIAGLDRDLGGEAGQLSCGIGPTVVSSVGLLRCRA
jgi:DNA-binding MarR family transcriptional regulator